MIAGIANGASSVVIGCRRRGDDHTGYRSLI
jgi:hypothetical protein